MKWDYKKLSEDDQVVFVHAVDMYLILCRKLKLISKECDTITWNKFADKFF
jgi:hypothetical protein